MRRLTLWAIALFSLTSHPILVHAVVPGSITVQGRLTDTGGNPLPPGFKSFTFKIFDAASSGTEVWPVAVNEEDQFLSTESIKEQQRQIDELRERLDRQKR
jgi:hypothetical protein